jgi:hypothetical protein
MTKAYVIYLASGELPRCVVTLTSSTGPTWRRLLRYPRSAGTSSILSHSITVPLATAHVILKRLSHLEHALDVLHTEDRLLSKGNRLRRLDRVLDLQQLSVHTPRNHMGAQGTRNHTCRPFILRLLSSSKSTSVNGFMTSAALSSFASLLSLPFLLFLSASASRPICSTLPI